MWPLDIISSTDEATKTILEMARKYIALRDAKMSEKERQSALARAKPVKGDEVLQFDPILGNFVSCNNGFIQQINWVKQTVDRYVIRESSKRPLNVLLAAAPGSGKSFFVKELARVSDADIKFLEYHVASFRDINDLFSVLQRIQSLNLQKKIPFILFDEVDAKVGGRFLFSNLLAPLWDGQFHIGQETHALGKAVIFFAASSLLPSPSVNNVLKGKHQSMTYQEYYELWLKLVQSKIGGSGIEKARDFIDRMDYVLCIPPTDAHLTDGSPEKEYWLLSCLLIKKHFEHVKRVEKSAAWALIRALAATGSRRKAESIVFRSFLPNDISFQFSYLPEDVQKAFETDQEIIGLHNTFFEIHFGE
ncbi:MAG: ATP-binding protein [Desulfobacteraceae bacterium]|nr:ATP-binding protein [Desulfobacteraceae bacterium]MBC2751332.1 ATP-binding protein [Desulfobacteraceae bacterium]